MKDSSKTAKRMVLAASYTPMEDLMRASGKMIRWTATVSYSIPTARLLTKDIGWKTSSMVLDVSTTKS